LDIENNIEPGQNILDTKLLKFYNITCFGEKSSKYTSMKTALLFLFPPGLFFSPLNIHSSPHILQIIFITLLFKFSYTCSTRSSSTMCVCKAQSATLKHKSTRLFTVFQCWEASKIRDHRRMKNQ